MATKTTKSKAPDAEDFYAIKTSEFYFRHDDFEEVEIRVNNQSSELEARKIARRFIAWLQGQGPGRE
jgi:hypothetical protein